MKSFAHFLQTKKIRQAREESLARQNADIKLAESITREEADWAIGRIERDGVIHENERALIQFMAENASDIDPVLEELIEKVA